MNNTYSEYDLFQQILNGNRLSHFEDLPKLFIFEHCRGNKVDNGVYNLKNNITNEENYNNTDQTEVRQSPKDNKILQYLQTKRNLAIIRSTTSGKNML